MAKSSTEPRYWLFKSEPESFSFDDLANAPKSRASWDGVRNYQARNFLRDDVHVGDGVLFYHSSTQPPGVVGVARIVAEASVDPTQFDPRDDHFDPKSERDEPRWVQVGIEAAFQLEQLVPLEELRKDARLKGMALLQRGQRLSIQPVTAAEWKVVLELGGAATADFDAGRRGSRRSPRIR